MTVTGDARQPDPAPRPTGPPPAAPRSRASRPGAAPPQEPPVLRHLRPLDFPTRLRLALGRFTTGVAVVTFEGPGGRRGLTVNSFTSVSLTPPLLLVSVAKTTAAHDQLPGRPFAVNILGAEQQGLALQFAGRPSLEPAWTEGAVAPYLTGALAHFECEPWKYYDGGDHTLFLGEIREFDARSGDALGFVGSRFTSIPEFAESLEDLI